MAMAAPPGVAAPRSTAMPRGGTLLSRIQPAALRISPRDSGRTVPKGATQQRLRRTASFPGAPDVNVPKSASAMTVYSGMPSLTDGRAVLWEDVLPEEATLSRIEVDFADPAPETIDRGLALWIYVEDLAMPRARIRLADLARLGGRRPLNLRVPAGGLVRVVLVDGNGVWSTTAPRISVRITA